MCPSTYLCMASMIADGFFICALLSSKLCITVSISLDRHNVSVPWLASLGSHQQVLKENNMNPIVLTMQHNLSICLCWDPAWGGCFGKRYTLVQSLVCQIQKWQETTVWYNNTTTLSGAFDWHQGTESVVRMKVNNVLHQLEAGYTSVHSAMYWLTIMWPMIQLVNMSHYNYNYYDMLQLT